VRLFISAGSHRHSGGQFGLTLPNGLLEVADFRQQAANRQRERPSLMQIERMISAL